MQPTPRKQPSSVEELAGGQFPLPSLPAIVVELIDSLEDADSDLSRLVEKIARDQAIVAKVMRLANSSFFGFPGGVASIREAVTLLGFNSVRNLVVTSSLMDLFPDQGGAFDWAEFWRHSINTGACARLLAAKVHQDREAAFLAGILHDVGRLLVGVYLPEQFAASLKYQDEAGVTLVDAEQQVWKTDHARLGAAVARRWRLPTVICHAIEGHHAPQATAGMPLTDIIYLANVLDQELSLSPAGTELSEFLAEETQKRLGLDRQGLSQVAAQMAAASGPLPD